MNQLKTFFFLIGFSAAFGQDKRQTADSLYDNDHFEEANKLYAELVNEFPEDPLITYRYGYVHYRTGELDKGIELIKRSLVLNDDKSPTLTYTAWSRLAKIYSLKNEKATALMWLEKAVDKGYNGFGEFKDEPHFANIRPTEKFQELQMVLEKRNYPCRFDENFRAFDFWIGEWDVYRTNTANLVGHSIIEDGSGGCSVIESWQSLVSTHEGKSINYYNSDKGYWEQFWQGSQNDRQHFLNGELKDNAMYFDYVDSEGKKGTLTFFKLNENTVLQYSELETEKGSGEFTVAYDLTYKRKK